MAAPGANMDSPKIGQLIPLLMTNTQNLRFDISSQSISSDYNLECNFFTKEEDEKSLMHIDFLP